MMRKFLIILMAVLMLSATLAALPVSAYYDEDYTQSRKDGTTVEDAEYLNLVVTEMMSDTISSVGTRTADAFQYIEVYNRGDCDVNLYDLAIVRGANVTSEDVWNKKHGFEAKLSINPGDIYANTAASNKNNPCMNPNTATVKPGQFAIIWFWNDSTNSVSNTFGASLGQAKADAEGKPVFHYYFREHYKAQTTDAAAREAIDNALIVAVYAGSTTDTVNKPTFDLNQSGSYMYGLVKDEASRNFDVKNEVAYSSYSYYYGSPVYERNDKVVCLWQWGVGTRLSVPRTSHATEGLASTYVPANCAPDFLNAMYREIRGTAYTPAQNYYELGLVEGFKELALWSYREAPTIAAMSAWQWVYVDPLRAPDAVTGNGYNWQQNAINAYIAQNVWVGVDVTAHEEVNLNQSEIRIDRDLLGNQGQNEIANKERAAVYNGAAPVWEVLKKPTYCIPLIAVALALAGLGCLRLKKKCD